MDATNNIDKLFSPSKPHRKWNFFLARCCLIDIWVINCKIEAFFRTEASYGATVTVTKMLIEELFSIGKPAELDYGFKTRNNRWNVRANDFLAS
jgi:hypothetical protein